jgi:hypothetical protein
MIELCLTVDAESSKEMRDGRLVHQHFERDVLAQCGVLDALAVRYDARLTFFYPFSELASTDRRAIELARRLSSRHEVAVHLHEPFASWSTDEIAQRLADERETMAAATGAAVTSVRAGGYNSGDQRGWIAAMHEAGLGIDSSVWPGASTDHTWESGRGADVDAAIWGGGGVAYDYRGAPTGGLYRTAADSLTTPGEGGVLEAPIAAAVYEERDARPFLLDVHGLTLEVLIRSIEHIGRIADGPALVVLLLHSYGVTGARHLTAVGRRVEGLLRWARDQGIPVRTLASAAAEAHRFGPIWALDQHERWTPVDRSDLAGLVARCPRCGSRLADLVCSSCGWVGTRLSPTLVDARTESTQPPVARTAPTRGSRYLRAALSLGGGALGVVIGSLLGLAARTRRAR